jgi:hypothetical protein
LVENPEYIKVIKDAAGHLLGWIRKSDGGIDWAVGVPTPVMKYVDGKIAEIWNGNEGTQIDGLNKIISFVNGFSTSDKLITLLNVKVDKITGKSLIDSDFASMQSSVENPEFMNVEKDGLGKIVACRYKNGKAKEFVGSEVKEIDFETAKGKNIEVTEQATLNDVFVNGSVTYETLPPQVKSYIQSKIYYSELFNNPNIYHFAPNYFIRVNGKYAVASQSLDDVEVAARLGFKFIEANIHQTQDGKFICIHGDSGHRLGEEVMSIDENVISTSDLRNTVISSVTLDFIKTYARYNSYFPKYRTEIPTLEEFCMACKQYGIGILAGCGGSKEALEICIKFLGNNVIAYTPSNDVRDYFNGPVFLYYNYNISVNALLSHARSYGAPFISCLSDSAIDNLGTEAFKGFIEAMHKENFLVAAGGVYSTETRNREYLKMGVDMLSSGHEVNSFGGNNSVYDLESDASDFVTTGTIANGIITLSQGDTLSLGESEIIGLGKVWLNIKYEGNLSFDFGQNGTTDRTNITADGKETMSFSDFLMKKTNEIVITANSNTTISKLLYKSSKC